jgi:shikimate kinase
MNIILLGFMGSGQTTLGKLLADELEYTFIDSDQYIESRERKTIPEIFKDHGEPYFRKKEKEFLLHVKLLDKCIISTGAGLPCIGDNMQQLNELGITVWLDVDEPVLVERLKKDSASRPKLVGFDSIEEAVLTLLGNRKNFYEQAKLQMKNPTPESFVRIVKHII